MASIKKAVRNIYPRGRFRKQRLILTVVYLAVVVITVAFVSLGGEKKKNVLGVKLNSYRSQIPTGIDEYTETTSFVISNKSKQKWTGVKIVLNDEFWYWKRELEPGKIFTVFAHEFSKKTTDGKIEKASHDIEVKKLEIICNMGKYVKYF